MVEPILFIIGATAAIVGALGVVGARNPVHSALFLLLTMVMMAMFFLMQGAQLVAIIQIVVYASAIVVLFLFVITLLGVDKREVLLFPEPVRFQRPVAFVLGLLLFGLIARIGWNDWTTGERTALGPLQTEREGNIANLAETLFTDYVWAFEITAVLLVVAVVGGVVLARRSRRPVQHDPVPEGAA
ncbi:MAG: NADH-quinone oxidoreductase subunit J [Actinomycetota bacterium]